MNLIVDTTINKAIDDKLIADNKKRESEHKSSGKLSAGMLSFPLQWQVLKLLGVEPVPFDAYTLRKFKRGRDIEDWLVKEIPGLVEQQKFIEYRGCVGYADAIVDTKDYENKVGVIPHEVKSVTNDKYKWISKRESPDDGHVLQAAMYAMGMGADNFAIDYVASDDLRISSFLIPLTGYLKARVDKIIDDFRKQWDKKEVPVFEPLYSWQKNKTYSKYPEWQNLDEDEIKAKMIRLDINFPK